MNSQRTLPITTQDKVHRCSLGFTAVAILGNRIPCTSRRNPHTTRHAGPHRAVHDYGAHGHHQAYPCLFIQRPRKLTKPCASKQHHLLQHRRRISGCTDQIVLEALIEMRQVNRVIEQVAEQMFDRARNSLPRKRDSEESWAGVDALLADHDESECLRPKGYQFDRRLPRGFHACIIRG